MPQDTFVTKVPRGQFAALRARLSGGSFEYRSVPHAEFSAKGDGMVATRTPRGSSWSRALIGGLRGPLDGPRPGRSRGAKAPKPAHVDGPWTSTRR